VGDFFGFLYCDVGVLGDNLGGTHNHLLGGNIAFDCFLGDCLVDVAADFNDFVFDFDDCLCGFVIQVLGSFDGSVGEIGSIFSSLFDSVSDA